MTTAELAPPRPHTRLVAIGGTIAVLLTVVMVGALDFQRASESVELLRRSTISAYALGPQRWVFDSAVLLLVFGSMAFLGVLVRRGITRWFSGGAIAWSLWSLGLALVVVFPKNDWSVGPSMSGSIHRFASLVAFVSLPIAVTLLARPWLRHEVWGGHARWVSRFGTLSWLAFTPIVYAILVNVAVGTSWWRVIPLGYVERVLVITEVIAVLVVGFWAIAAAKRPRLV